MQQKCPGDSQLLTSQGSNNQELAWIMLKRWSLMNFQVLYKFEQQCGTPTDPPSWLKCCFYREMLRKCPGNGQFLHSQGSCDQELALIMMKRWSSMYFQVLYKFAQQCGTPTDLPSWLKCRFYRKNRAKMRRSAHFKPLWTPHFWCQGHENRTQCS